MSESYDYAYPLGTHKGRMIRLAVDLSDAVDTTTTPVTTDFAVWLFYWMPSEDAPDASHEHIVRIDDRKHGGPHIDRFYSDEGGKDTSLPSDFDAEDAEERLREDWRHFTDTYYQAHGGWR